MYPNTQNLRREFKLKDVYESYSLIKAKQYFIDFCKKSEYDTQRAVGGWVGEDFSVNIMLSMGRIKM